MSNVRSIYGGTYLTAPDVSADPVRARIVGVHCDDRLGKIVVDLEGVGKALVLNKTNAETLARELGDETDGWIGAEITIAVQRVRYMGQLVDGIRVADVHRAGAPGRSTPKR